MKINGSKTNWIEIKLMILLFDFLHGGVRSFFSDDSDLEKKKDERRPPLINDFPGCSLIWLTGPFLLLLLPTWSDWWRCETIAPLIIVDDPKGLYMEKENTISHTIYQLLEAAKSNSYKPSDHEVQKRTPCWAYTKKNLGQAVVIYTPEGDFIEYVWSFKCSGSFIR